MKRYIDQIPDYTRVYKYAEYWDFVKWIATPTPLRKPANQREFAKVHSMHETTLSKWRRMPEFRRDVINAVAEMMHDDLSDVMYSLKNRIFKDGSAAEVKLFLEWATKWIPEVRITGDGSGSLSDEAKRLVTEYEEKLKNLKTK